jgi:hypothetical protein
MGRNSAEAANAWWIRAVRATRAAFVPRWRAECRAAALPFADFLVVDWVDLALAVVFVVRCGVVVVPEEVWPYTGATVIKAHRTAARHCFSCGI